MASLPIRNLTPELLFRVIILSYLRDQIVSTEWVPVLHPD